MSQRSALRASLLTQQLSRKLLGRRGTSGTRQIKLSLIIAVMAGCSSLACREQGAAARVPEALP